MSVCPLGFRDGYPYSHPHTLFFLESANVRTDRFRPEQLRAKMLMFAFGNALAKAKALHGVRMGACCWAPLRPLLLQPLQGGPKAPYSHFHIQASQSRGGNPTFRDPEIHCSVVGVFVMQWGGMGRNQGISSAVKL